MNCGRACRFCGLCLERKCFENDAYRQRHPACFGFGPLCFVGVRRLRGLLPGGRYCFQCDGRRCVPRGGKRRDHLLPALPRGGAFPQPGGRHPGPGLRDPAGRRQRGLHPVRFGRAGESLRRQRGGHPGLAAGFGAGGSQQQRRPKRLGRGRSHCAFCGARHRPLRLRAAVFPGFLGAAGGRGRL